MDAGDGIGNLDECKGGGVNTPLLVGNSFAVLVAANELARRGQAATLLTDGKPLGGHFAGTTAGGINFDVGMVMLEKHFPETDCRDLSTYDPSVRNDWTRFGRLAGDWLDENCRLVRAASSECLIGGKVYPDYLISDRLDCLTHSHLEPPRALAADDPHHASRKSTSTAYDALTYEQASLANHGAQFHARFIEPFVKKLTGRSSSDLLARFHRAAWAPLYYPETMAKALAGQPAGLKEYPFWTTESGFIGEVIADLCHSIKASGKIALVEAPLTALNYDGNEWTAAAGDRGSFNAPDIALGLPPERALELLGLAADKVSDVASVSVLFANVKSSSMRSRHANLMVPDGQFASYRLTDQDALAGVQAEYHRVTIEAAPDLLARMHPGLDGSTSLQLELKRLLGISQDDAVHPLKFITAANALVLPTPREVARAHEMHVALTRAAPRAHLTAGLLGYGVSSMNDQLVQGLKIAEEFA